MLDLLKNDLKKFAISVGSVTLGMLFSNLNFVIPDFSGVYYVLIPYFIIIWLIYYGINKDRAVKVGFESAVIETLLMVVVYILPFDTNLKSFLYGVFVYILISSIFNKIKEVGKFKEAVIGVLYILIAVVVGILYFRFPGSIMYFKGFENLSNEMLLLFSLVSLIGSIV
ncbi:phosphatidate cytidylyltransferase [Leptotrichia trevisanii]